MATRLFITASLAAFFGLGLVGRAQAQSAYAPPPPVANQPMPQKPIPAPVVTQAAPQQPTAEPVVVETTVSEAQPAYHAHPVRDALENHRPLHNAVANYLPLGCWANHNEFGSGSFKSEVTYIFGSSRAFFGQPCMKGPPPDELAPWREANGETVNPPRTRPVWCPSCR